MISLEKVIKGDLLDKVKILAGVAPLRSLKTALYIQENIPDIFVPEDLIDRMESSKTPEWTGLEIALELIRRIRTMPGVSGVHLMNLGWDSFYPRVLKEAGLTRSITLNRLN